MPGYSSYSLLISALLSLALTALISCGGAKPRTTTIEIPVPIPTTLPDALPPFPPFPIGWLPVEEGCPEHLVCYEPEADRAGTAWMEEIYRWRDTVLRYLRVIAREAT